MKKDDKENIKKFISEIYMLKRIRHEGWRLAGISHPGSIAEHKLIAAQLSYILAKLEGADASKCALITLFHDNEEIRLGDQHKINSRYIKTKGDIEEAAQKDHFSLLPVSLESELLELEKEFNDRSTKEGIIAKDADWLEMALQAKIYLEQGNNGTQDWIENVRHALETKSAIKILELIIKEKDFINCWWRGLKKMTYNKLERK